MSEAPDEMNPFVSCVFAVAGTLARRTQMEVKIGVEIRGATFKSGLSKKTTFVVAGDNANLDKARALGVTVLDEAAFEEMLAKVPVTAEMRAKYLS